MARARRHSAGAFVWALASIGVLTAAPAAGQDAAGVEMALSAAAVGGSGPIRHGAPMRVELSVAQQGGAAPLPTERPSVWLVPHDPGLADMQACTARARGLLASSLVRRAAVDLNQFRLVTVHRDGTLAFINPEVAFSRTRVETVMDLGGHPAGSDSSAGGRLLWLAMPEQDRVIGVDLQAREVFRTVALPAGTSPTSVVALKGSGRVLALGAGAMLLDGASGRIVASVADSSAAVAAGEGRIAMLAGRRVLVMDASSGRIEREVPLGATARGLAFDSVSGLVWVGDGAVLLGFDPSRNESPVRVPVGREVGRIDRLPEGRVLLLTSAAGEAMTVLDTAGRSVSPWLEIAGQVEDVAFGPAFAYVSNPTGGRLLVLSLAQLRAGRFTPVEATLERSPAPPRERSSLIVPSPDGTGAILALPGKSSLGVYLDGTMALAGTLRGLGTSSVVGLHVLDARLAPAGQGHWSAVATAPPPGRYDAVVAIDSPRLAKCFPVSIDPVAASAGPSAGPALALELPRAGLLAGEDAAVVVRVTDAAGSPLAGLRDVQMIAVELPGVWHQVRTGRDLGDGRYAVKLRFPHAGAFALSVALPSRGIAHGAGASARIVVDGKETPQ